MIMMRSTWMALGYIFLLSLVACGKEESGSDYPLTYNLNHTELMSEGVVTLDLDLNCSPNTTDYDTTGVMETLKAYVGTQDFLMETELPSKIILVNEDELKVAFSDGSEDGHTYKVENDVLSIYFEEDDIWSPLLYLKDEVEIYYIGYGYNRLNPGANDVPTLGLGLRGIESDPCTIFEEDFFQGAGNFGYFFFRIIYE